MPETNVQKDNASKDFTYLQLSPSFQLWKTSKTISRAPAPWHPHHQESVFFNSVHYFFFLFFFFLQAVLPVHNSLICICYNSSPWGGFGSFCKSRIKCFHRFNLGWSCQHRGRRCRRSSWGRGSIYTVNRRNRKTRIERNLVLVTYCLYSLYWSETILKIFHSSSYMNYKMLFPLSCVSILQALPTLKSCLWYISELRASCVCTDTSRQKDSNSFIMYF